MKRRQAWIIDALGRYERPLMRYATRLLGDTDAARDVVQECFLELCRQKRGDLDGRLGPWLFTVCRNRAFDQLRKRKKDGRMGALEHTEPAAEPDDTVERGEQALHLRDRIAEVARPPAGGAAAQVQEGLSYREIATIVDISVSNVGFLLHSAIKTLRGRLAPAQGEEA